MGCSNGNRPIERHDLWIGLGGDRRLWQTRPWSKSAPKRTVVNGHPVYDAWWEMYSTGKRQPEQVITGMTVEPGDSITASVQYITSGAHAGQFYLSIVDNSRANDSFSTYESSSQSQSPLAQRSYGRVDRRSPYRRRQHREGTEFRIGHLHQRYRGDQWSLGRDQRSFVAVASARTLASNGVTYDTTSVLTSSGTSFVVTYNSSAGAAVLAGSNVEAKTQSGAAAGTTLQSGKKIGSPVLGGPAWTGATGLSGFRTPIRQLKRSAQEFLIDQRWN